LSAEWFHRIKDKLNVRDQMIIAMNMSSARSAKENEKRLEDNLKESPKKGSTEPHQGRQEFADEVRK
jgi:hypothetical protein